MAAEEEEEGGGEVTTGGVRVQGRPQMKKGKVSCHVRADCCPAGPPFLLYPPSVKRFPLLVSSEAEELGTRELDIGNKKIYIDLRLNDQGKFVRIVEASLLPPPPLPLLHAFIHLGDIC